MMPQTWLRQQCDVPSVKLQGRVTFVLRGMSDGDAEALCTRQPLVTQEIMVALMVCVVEDIGEFTLSKASWDDTERG